MITGGVASLFSFLLPLNAVGAGIILGRHAGFAIAAFSSILYSIAMELQYYDILHVPFDISLTFRDFLYNIFTNVISLFLIAYLSRYLIVKEEATLKRLRETESDFHDLYSLHSEVLQNIRNGLIYTGIDGRIVLFNYSAALITGLDRVAIVDRPISEVFDFIGQDITPGGYRKTIIVGEVTKIIDMYVSEHLDNDGGNKGYIFIFTDVTKLAEMEGEIKKQEKLAAIGELSANIAHEIRNPLAALKSSIELLKEKKTSEQNSQRLMDIAIKEMDRLNNIITDFLIYSSPGKTLSSDVVLTQILDETLDMMNSMLASKNGVSIDRNYSGTVRIMGDGNRLRQVFWNLALNAFDAVGPGGNISVSLHKSGDFAKISFRDTGSGIKEGDMDKIFYPFFTTKAKGTGLGLAIVYRTIKDHGGDIIVKSERGHGTTFEITLPIGVSGVNV